MKKLYVLSLFFSPAHWFICASIFFLSLYIILDEKLYNSFGSLDLVWENELPSMSMLAENISICEPTVNSSGIEGKNSFFNEQFTFASTGEIKWSQVIAQVPTRINEAQAVVVGSKMYVFGGFDYLKSCCTPTARAYVFDPKASKWTRIKDMPAMNGTAHGGVTHAGFTTDGVDIYFAGGYTSDNAGTKQIFGTAEVWKYDLSSNTYSRLPDLPMAVAAGGLQYLNGKLHWIGGTNQARTQDLGNHYVLDLSQTAKGWSTATFLPNPRNHLSSAVHESKIYVFGGHHGHNNNLVTQDDVHVYDPATNQWKQLADLPQPLSHMAGATFTVGERIFIIGGHNAALQDVRQAIAYNPKSNDWTKFSDPPTSNVSVAGTIDNVIYYVTDGGATYKGTLATEPGSTENDIWLEAECGSVGSNWVKVSDATASAGSYLAIKSGYNSINNAPSGSSNIVSYSFNIAQTGNYHIYTRVKAPTHSDNSFWIRVDGGAWLMWSIPLASAFDWRQVQNSPFTFSTTGTHTIEFAPREDGTLLDKVYLTATSTVPTDIGEAANNNCTNTNNPSLWLEAECGTSVGSNWMQHSDASASAGSYLSIKNGLNSYTTAPAATADIVSFSFNINETGSYKMFARVKAPNHNSNSFWIRVDGGVWVQWSISPGTTFSWHEMKNSPFSLNSTGTHTLQFAYRESGTQLDKIYISSTTTLPDGVGSPASNCANTQTLTKNIYKDIKAAAQEQHIGTEDVDLSYDHNPGIAVFPNPSEGIFTVRFLKGEINGSFYLKLSTLQGEIINHFNYQKHASNILTVNLENVSSGVYLLQIFTDEGVIVKRIEKL